MGAWGTSLYANDSASDIRGDYVDKLKRGKTNAEATQELIEENRDQLADEEEGPLFWFALADTQWNYGRLLPEVKERALSLIPLGQEDERWREAGEKKAAAWKNTLDTLKKKLETPQPPEKKVYRYRLYRCKWQLGDVFAYRFSSPYSEECGYYGKYIAFRKASEYRWWPGHIVPVILIYNWIGDQVPTLEELANLDFLPIPHSHEPPVKAPADLLKYGVQLIVPSGKGIPPGSLTFLGNLPGDDLVPYPGDRCWIGYWSAGWETSRYNLKFEHLAIQMLTTQS